MKQSSILFNLLTFSNIFAMSNAIRYGAPFALASTHFTSIVSMDIVFFFRNTQLNRCQTEQMISFVRYSFGANWCSAQPLYRRFSTIKLIDSIFTMKDAHKLTFLFCATTQVQCRTHSQLCNCKRRRFNEQHQFPIMVGISLQDTATYESVDQGVNIIGPMISREKIDY